MPRGDNAGRPEKVLTPEQVEQVETLASVLTTEQLADYFGIGRRTFYDIMQRDEDIAARYKRGKAKAIGIVAKNLMEKARSGNIAAQIFFLKTQAGWKETVAVENVVPPTVVMEYPDGFTPED